MYDSWQPKDLGEGSIVRKITNTEKPKRAVIIKSVAKELTDKEIQNSLNEQFDGSKGTRFVKRDSTVLGTVKLVLKTDGDVQKALEHGLFIDMIYYSASPFIQKEIQIIRCFKCQKFGHVSANCKSETKCGHCCGEHSFQDCENKTKTPKCSNCGSDHPASYQLCDVYQRQLTLVLNSRGMHPPHAVDRLSEMVEKTLSFLQINICGISDRSQVVLNNYMNTHKPMICCLNETKKILEKNAFTNYYTEPTCKSSYGGIALVIRNDIFNTRLSDLEAEDFDNAWILTSIAGLKIVVGTTYLRPNQTEQMTSFLRQKENVANFIVKHDLTWMVCCS